MEELEKTQNTSSDIKFVLSEQDVVFSPLNPDH